MRADSNGAAMANCDHVHATNGVTAHHTNGVSVNGVNGNAPVSVGIDGVNGYHHLNGQDSSFQQKPFDGLQEPMAIVGMAMRLPGGVRNTESFWDMLINKRDGRCRVPADRYNVDAFYSAALKRGTVKMQHGYFLEDVDLRDLDPSFFSMTKSEVEKLDPQHRLLLEVVRECLENAGETKWRGKKIGCYVGVFGEDWQDIHAKDTQDFGMYRITGYGDFLLGNRVSYEYDFTGPRYVISSSSLPGLHAIVKGF